MYCTLIHLAAMLEALARIGASFSKSVEAYASTIGGRNEDTSLPPKADKKDKTREDPHWPIFERCEWLKKKMGE